MEDLAEEIVWKAVDLGADYASIRIERNHVGSVTVGNGEVEKSTFGYEEGAGVSVLANGAWGFSSSSKLEIESLTKAVSFALKIAKNIGGKLGEKEKAELADVPTIRDKTVELGKEKLKDMSIEEKINFSLEADREMRGIDGRIKGTTVNYMEGYGELLFMSNEGAKIVKQGSRCYISFQAVAIGKGKIQSYRTRVAHKGGFEGIKSQDPFKKAVESSKKALNLLSGKNPPSGRFTVIMDPELLGVFIHEALGHAAESDLVVSGESILADKMERKIGSDHVTVYDDSTVKWWGSEKYDDEGVPTRKRLIIKEGVLKGYLLNRETAAKLNLEPNGSARAMSYRHRPLVRMSNTYMDKGDYSFEEMLEGIKRGVYVKGSRGGQVDTAMGTFQFNAQEAYLIKDGALDTPLIDVSLSGLTLETLLNVEAVGKDLSLHVGFCGKSGQLVPVGDGGPHVRVKEVVIGGKQI